MYICIYGFIYIYRQYVWTDMDPTSVNLRCFLHRDSSGRPPGGVSKQLCVTLGKWGDHRIQMQPWCNRAATSCNATAIWMLTHGWSLRGCHWWSVPRVKTTLYLCELVALVITNDFFQEKISRKNSRLSLWTMALRMWTAVGPAFEIPRLMADLFRLHGP